MMSLRKQRVPLAYRIVGRHLHRFVYRLVTGPLDADRMFSHRHGVFHDRRLPDVGAIDENLAVRVSGNGVVGALVTSVGASADAFRAGGGGRRWLLAAPALGTATGCSGHTAVANSSMVGKRWSGSLDSARVIAAVRNGGVSPRFAPALGTSSKMCLDRKSVV